MTKKELETRLTAFSTAVLKEVQQLRKEPARNHLVGQIIRSSTAAALNYGEAQSAESRRDFIHKIGVVSKELRETFINLNLIKGLEDPATTQNWNQLLSECNELIAIFHKTIQTARKNSGDV